MSAKGITYHAKDVLFKSMSSIYKEKALDVYGLNYPKIIDMLPSDLPEVKADEKRADSIFLLEDGSILLLEYESNKRVEENMFKYLDYAIRVIRRHYEETKKFPQIRIAVIYTSDVKEAKESMSFGDININSQSVFMAEFNGDEILLAIRNKINNKISLTVEDKMRLILLPLMSSKRNKQEIIAESIELVKKLEDDVEQVAIIAGVLTATDKFINKDYAENVRKWLSMTKVDKIYQEEKEKAIEETRRQEKIGIARKLLDILSIEMIAEKTGLTIEEVQSLKSSN